jgi:predicted fused transcriptional regulator/phosphomethylpyrimidine kinase
LSASLPPSGRAEISIPCGIGELIDKITILEIKADHVMDVQQLDNVRYELSLLRVLKIKHGLVGSAIDRLEHELKNTNMALWDIEDALRLHEADQNFGADFVELARQVYQTNDRRAALKKAINILFKSTIVEEKFYASTPKRNSGAQ